jgi:hypothetical protein
VRLLDRRPRPQRRLDGKRVTLVDVALHEALALFRYRATNVARYRTVAAQNLGAPVIDVEAIDSEGCYGERAGLPAARRASDYNHPRASHVPSPRLECRIRVRQHIRRQLVRDELTVDTHDTELLEPRSRAREPRCSQLR